MTQPNIVNVSSIKGETRCQHLLTSSSTPLAENASASGKVYKVNSLLVANVDGLNAATVDVYVVRGTTNTGTFYICKSLTVPASSTLDVLSGSIYLEENDNISAVASATGDLDATVSYEVLDDA